jgi:hypothetical protein
MSPDGRLCYNIQGRWENWERLLKDIKAFERTTMEFLLEKVELSGV